MQIDFKRYHWCIPKLLAGAVILFVGFVIYQLTSDDKNPAEEVGVLGKTNDFIEKVAAAARDRRERVERSARRNVHTRHKPAGCPLFHSLYDLSDKAAKHHH